MKHIVGEYPFEAIQKLYRDGSGVAVRKDRLVRLGEWQWRFDRAEIIPAQCLLVWPRKRKSARKSLRLYQLGFSY
jgi:hypothetical protein